ncbi:DNA gyrase C-terminal beta-propeller domain-containing protein, partial [Leptospira bandrabouensis]|uniref:DNA gyrase C-terminal beta-propeller domain-containing protein n=1 Tax=Leptospira bandrabouensis TaxID=2484903 RepID=UPI0023AA76C0
NMFLSNVGKVYVLKAYDLPLASKESRGKSLKAIINLREYEYVSSVFTFREEDMEKDLLLVTRRGFIKRIQLKEFSNVKKSGIIAIGLRDGDDLIKVEAIEDKDEVMIFSRKGLALRIEGNSIRAQGRTASGVTGMRLSEDDAIVGLSKLKEGEDIFVVSEEGYGKRLGFEELAAKG